MTAERQAEEKEVRLEEKANLMKREKPRRRCICNANIWPTLPEGRKNESVETGGNEIERPIALANPISNSSSSARSNHVLRRCAILAKKKIRIFPSLITGGKILEISETAIRELELFIISEIAV